MKGIVIEDKRPKSNFVSIGSLAIEQVFQLKDGSYGIVLEQDCARCITTIYNFGAHCLDWLICTYEVIPVAATLTIESGGVKP